LVFHQFAKQIILLLGPVERLLLFREAVNQLIDFLRIWVRNDCSRNRVLKVVVATVTAKNPLGSI
jgi:hypothetical protein